MIALIYLCISFCEADALRKYEVQEAESNASRMLQERRQKFKRFLDSRSLSSEEDVSRVKKKK